MQVRNECLKSRGYYKLCIIMEVYYSQKDSFDHRGSITYSQAGVSMHWEMVYSYLRCMMILMPLFHTFTAKANNRAQLHI